MALFGGKTNAEERKYVLSDGKLEYFLTEPELDEIDYFTIADDKNSLQAVMKNEKVYPLKLSTFGGFMFDEEADSTAENSACKRLERAGVEAEKMLTEQNAFPTNAQFIPEIGAFRQYENGKISYYSLIGDRIDNITLYTLGLNSLVANAPFIVSNGTPKTYCQKPQNISSLWQAYETYTSCFPANKTALITQNMYLTNISDLLSREVSDKKYSKQILGR